MTGATAFQKATRGGEINQWNRQEFLSLYPNRHKSILKPRGCKGWTTLSRHAPLGDEKILSAISGQEKNIWGCRWGEQTNFAVLDVDATSQYHNELGLARLRHILTSVGFDRPAIYQSSSSGGWHIYLFFSNWEQSQELQEKLSAWLRSEGFEIRQGQLEIFPSNNGLRFPLQSGFAWLNSDAEILVRRDALESDDAIGKFLSDRQHNSHDWKPIEHQINSRLEQIAIARTVIKPQEQPEEEDGFSAFFSDAGRLQDVYIAGRDYWLNGLTEPGQRHHAILAVGHYLWYGDEQIGLTALPGLRNSDRRAALIERWLKEKHNGHSQSVLKNDWNEIGADISRACKWQQQEATEPLRSYPLTERAIDRLEGLTKTTGRVWMPEDFQKGNIGREDVARNKIRAALTQLIEQGRRVTVRGLERASGCRRETIRRHADIWGIFRLSNGLGDLSCAPPPPGAVSPVLELPETLNLDFESSASENIEPTAKLQLVERASARILFSVFDSLRLKLFGATTNNSTACETHAIGSPLTTSLATGSNTGAHSAIAACAGGSSLGLAVRSLNGCPPAVAGPPHLPQTGCFIVAHSRALVTSRQGACKARDSFYGSSERQSNSIWWQPKLTLDVEMWDHRRRKSGRAHVIDLDALKLNFKGLSEEQKKAEGWRWYKLLYLTDPEKPVGIHELHDGEKAIFHDRTFDHAFFKSSNYQLHPKRKDLVDYVRLERVRWIEVLISGQVPYSSCFEVVALSGRPGIPNRVYIAHSHSYLVFLEPRTNSPDLQWRFSSAYPSSPNYITSKVTGPGTMIWTNKPPPG